MLVARHDDDDIYIYIYIYTILCSHLICHPYNPIGQSAGAVEYTDCFSAEG